MGLLSTKQQGHQNCFLQVQRKVFEELLRKIAIGKDIKCFTVSRRRAEKLRILGRKFPVGYTKLR